MTSHVSPGVYSKIIDLSEYLTSTSGTIGFLPIITEKGPDNVLTKISSIDEYRTKFGDPNLRTFGKYYGQGPYVALNHLSVSSDLYVLRALPDDAVYAHSFVAFAKIEDTAIEVDPVTKEATDIDAASDDKASNVSVGDTHVELVTFNVSKQSIKVDKNNYIHFGDMIDTQRLDSYFTSANSAQIITKVPNIYDADNAENCVLMYVRGYGRGDYYNNLSYLIRASSGAGNFGTYIFEIYQDQDGVPTLVESYNVSFDPNGLDSDGESNYIENVVNKYSILVHVNVNENALAIMNNLLHNYYDNDPTIEDVQEDYVVSNGGTNDPVGFPTTMEDADGVTYSMIPTYYDTDDLGSVTTSFPSEVGIYIGNTKIDNPEEVMKPELLVSNYRLGIKAKKIWNAYWEKALAKKQTVLAAKQYAEAIAMDEDDVTETDGSQKSRSEAINDAIVAVNEAQVATDQAQALYDTAISMSLMHLSDSNDDIYGDQPYYLMNGSLGSLIKTSALTGKKTVQASVANQILCLAYSGLLKKPIVVKKTDESTGRIQFKTQYCSDVLDTEWIYYTIVYDAGYKPDVKQMAKELVETRMDCVLISDCGDNSDCDSVELYTGAVKGATDCRTWNSFYCARYEPYTRIYDEYNGYDIWISPVYTMAKLIPQNDSLYNLWYAPAGFNRGISSEIKELRWNANLGERDRLYSTQVNPIVYFPEGMTVWGQLTTQKKSSSLSDLNVVRTVLYIKRAIEQYCRNYIFEFNSSDTWDKIRNGVAPMLSRIVSEGGIASYSIEVGATDYEYKTKTCHVNVTITPMRVIEQIQLNMYIN